MHNLWRSKPWFIYKGSLQEDFSQHFLNISCDLVEVAHICPTVCSSWTTPGLQNLYFAVVTVCNNCFSDWKRLQLSGLLTFHVLIVWNILEGNNSQLLELWHHRQDCSDGLKLHCWAILVFFFITVLENSACFHPFPRLCTVTTISGIMKHCVFIADSPNYGSWSWGRTTWKPCQSKTCSQRETMCLSVCLCMFVCVMEWGEDKRKKKTFHS